MLVLGGLGFFLLNQGQGGGPGGGPTAVAEATNQPLGPASEDPGASESSDSPMIGEEADPGQVVSLVDEVLTEEVGTYRLARRIDAGLEDTGAVDSAELRYNLDPASAETRIDHTIGVYPSASAAQDRVRDQVEHLTPPFEIGEERELMDPQGEVYGSIVTLNSDQGDLTFLLWSNQNVYFLLAGGEDADLEAFYNQLPY